MIEGAPRVFLVTDLARVPEAEFVRRVESTVALAPELRARLAVQLRDNGLSGRDRLALGRRLSALTTRIGARLFVNDRLDIARELGATGMHLRADSMSVADARALVPTAFVTRACHGQGDVLAAAGEGADGALLSPIFASPGKGAPLGLEAIAEARRALDESGFARFSLYALGGVGAAEAKACFDAGASGIAVVGQDLGSTLAACLAR